MQTTSLSRSGPPKPYSNAINIISKSTVNEHYGFKVKRPIGSMQNMRSIVSFLGAFQCWAIHRNQVRIISIFKAVFTVNFMDYHFFSHKG